MADATLEATNPTPATTSNDGSVEFNTCITEAEGTPETPAVCDDIVGEKIPPPVAVVVVGARLPPYGVLDGVTPLEREMTGEGMLLLLAVGKPVYVEVGREYSSNVLCISVVEISSLEEKNPR